MIENLIDMEKMYVIIVSGVIAIISSIIAYKLSVRKAQKDQKTQIFFKQKYEYFLKLKYWARELRGRLWHIDFRLFEKDDKIDRKEKKKKQDDMISRFQRNKISKDLKWFFNDDINEGGYFIFSTIYLQCMLFCCMQKVASEYPYISLKLNKNNSIPRLKKRTDMCDYLNKIKYAISGINGIPYGIIDSIGEFMIKEKKIMNYEEFCNEIIEDESRIKFEKVIFFWQNLCSSSSDIKGNIKVEKILKLNEILRELNQYNVDYM